MIDIKYAGVDWVTMTTKEDRVGWQWWDIYAAYRKQGEIEGGKAKPFNNGFYVGEEIDSFKWGQSLDIGYIVIMSGGDAERLYQRLQPARHKVTRLDLCIDFLADEPTMLAERLYRQMENQTEGRELKNNLWQGSDGGATFYLGSRSSQQYGRVYDKGVQSKTAEPGLLWRAEVEFKKPRSGYIAKALAKVSGADRELAICDTVCEWFGDRSAELFSWKGTDKTIHISTEARITTADRKLAWLRSQVSPSVIQLIEAGYGRQVLQSLLLDTKTLNKAMLGGS